MSFLQQVTQGVQGLQGLEMNAQNMQMQKQQMQQQERQQEREAEAEQLLSKFQQGGGKDFNLINQAILKSPTASKNVLATIGLQDEMQKKSAAADIAGIMPALSDPATFNRTMAGRIQAIKDRGGNPDDSIRLAQIYQEEGPEAARRELQMVGAALASEGYLRPEVIGIGTSAEAPNSQREFEYYQKLKAANPAAAAEFAKGRGYTDSPREQAQTTQERNMATYKQMIEVNDPNAEAFGQSAGLVSKEGRELSAQAQKRLSDFGDKATTAAVNVVKYNDLASQFDNGIEGGLISGSWGEYFKDITGNQDWRTELRRDFAQIRASEVGRNLPPGAASDADVAMALKPLPSDNASGAQVASFLRGMSKLAEYDKQFNEFKANFISENGTERGMVDAWKKYAADNKIKPETPQRSLGKDAITVGSYQVIEVQ